MKTGSNRYWAWEFLRRNHVYREAFQLASALKPEQQVLLQGMAHLVLAIENIEESLPFRAFNAPFNFDEDALDREKARSLDTLANGWSIGQVSALLVPAAKGDEIITLHEKYSLESYALTEWVDPKRSGENVDDEIFALSMADIRGLRKIETPPNAAKDVPILKPGETMWPFGIHKVIDPRRVYHGKSAFRPKWTFNGYEGKNGQYFARHEAFAMALGMTDLVVKISLALPLQQQLLAIEQCATLHLADLEAAGICEKLTANGTSRLFTDYLLLLDGIEEGISGGELAERIGLATFNKATGTYEAERFAWNKAPAAKDNLRQMVLRARALRDYEFLSLALA